VFTNTAGFKSAVSLLPTYEEDVAIPSSADVNVSISNGSYAQTFQGTGYLAASSASIAYGNPNVVHTYAIAEAVQTFTITGAGTLAFNIDYFLSSTATADWTYFPYSEYAYAREQVYAEIVRNPYGTNQEKSAEAKTELFGGPNSGTTVDNNTLNVAGLDFATGNTGYIRGYILSETWTVPEPLSVTLLGLGLLGGGGGLGLSGLGFGLGFGLHGGGFGGGLVGLLRFFGESGAEQGSGHKQGGELLH